VAFLPFTVGIVVGAAASARLLPRMGPRAAMVIGLVFAAAGMLMLTQVDPGDAYVTSVLPGVVVFGLGLVLVVSPITATVLAAADESHAGIASGINNAVARVAQLLAVAVLPVVAGITGRGFYDPATMTHGFHVAMIVAAALAVGGGVLAWLTISADALHAEPVRRGQAPVEVSSDYSCSLAGPPASRRAGAAA
jgi:MFS family permease